MYFYWLRVKEICCSYLGHSEICCGTFTVHRCFLFNASMGGGYFPASQKIANITPILKKASLDPLDLGNCRPISNLTFLSKLLERAAYEQIVGYMKRHQLLPSLQSAYQKNRSTETATIKVMSDIYRAADAGLVTLLGLLDLFRHCRPRDPSGSTPTSLRHLRTRARMDWVILDRAISIRSIQRRDFGDNDGHFRRPSGIGARPDSLHRVLCGSHWHRIAARFQRPRFRRWLTGLRARRAARCCSPSYADVHVHRERQGLDEFQPTLSQPFEDGADMVGL